MSRFRISGLGDSSLANWACILLSEPLLDAVNMVAMAAVQPSHLFMCFKLFLYEMCDGLYVMATGCRYEKSPWKLNAKVNRGTDIPDKYCTSFPFLKQTGKNRTMGA
jgi:hypothetical protein